MRHRILLILTACYLSAVSSASHAQVAASESVTSVSSKQAITVADLVREVVIGDPFSTSYDDSARRQHVGVTSPDGRHIAVVLRWGDIEREANIGALLVYPTSELLRSPEPRRMVEFASRTKRQPLALVRWLLDNRTLIFAATQGEGDGATQVYRGDIQTGAVERLTSEPSSVEWYDITPDGHRLVTSSKVATVQPDEDSACGKEGCLVTARTLWAAQSGSEEDSDPLTIYNLATGSRLTLGAPETSDTDIQSCESELKGGISPDGRFGLRTCILKSERQPQWWRNYEIDPEMHAALSKNNPYYALRLIITNLMSGESRTFMEAPYIWDQPAPVWIDGGRGLLLIGALEPLDDTTVAENARRRTQKALLLVDPVTRETERVGAFGADIGAITGSDWNQETQRLTLEITDAAGKPSPAVVYRRLGKSWTVGPSVQRPHRPSDGTTPNLLVEETLNTPPVLMALDPKSGTKTLVLDPNPWLAERQLGRVEEISWTLRNGQKWRGGLYYPPGYVPGVRYPLVILTHGFNDDRFSLYGYSRNFAAQPLAAHDMMVLQVEEKLRSVIATPAEWPTVQDGYEAAIDRLDQLGMIARDRVGIQGWSRTGPHIGYFITHSSHPISAAAITDAADFGWWYYIASGTPEEIEAGYGAAPFGAGLDAWREFAPTFNLDRVRTPMLMWSGGDVSGLWDWYAGLKRLNKPVEYWFLPDGAHDVFKVRERLLTNQLLVDWFRYWLKDEEDPDPTKSHQYKRWRELRALRSGSQ
jgi:dipeptidyl aminopeptidase/acylaminoacyl peptidase